MIDKISPYITYKDNKPVLLTEDLSKLKITEDELNELKEGFKLGENVGASINTPTDTGVSTTKLGNIDLKDITPNYTLNSTIDYNTSYLTITLTPTDVKCLLTVALIASLALVIAGACLGTFVSLTTLWWNPSNVIIKIPIRTINNGQGNYSWIGNNWLGISTIKTAYASS